MTCNKLFIALSLFIGLLFFSCKSFAQACTAAFSNSAPTCLNSATVFTDQSTSSGSTINSWAWDFGDGQTSTLQNPVHTYTSAGNYTVKLTIASVAGCSSSTINPVHVNAPPSAVFSNSAPDCESKDVTFTDNSTAGEGNLTKWVWTFGDNTTVTKTDKTPFTHQYAAAGTYSVNLTVTSSTGCTSTTTHTLDVHPTPQVSFTLPDVCLADATATFTNTTTVADNSAAQLTYLWNFGDASATALNPNTSTQKSPSHKYSQAKQYTVTLTVTSKDGCVSTQSQTFTVNGSNPTAALVSQNSTGINTTSFCNGDAVTFNAAASTVDFGNITKIVFYYDYDNAPTSATTYMLSDGTLPANKLFTHTYPNLTASSPKSYHVRMIAYSGGACASAPKDITVIINPIAKLSVSVPVRICQGAPPTQLSAAILNGVNGTGVFSGKGVSPAGVFNPADAGPGKFDINFVFTSDAGCTYTSTSIIEVDPNPKVTGTNITLLQGGTEKIVLPTPTGINPLTYKWTLANGNPATGLDRDDILSPTVTAVDDISYLFTVTSGEGCSTSVFVNVAVTKKLVIPNTFTPNGDGVNDTWNIPYLDTYAGCTITIFNRYGLKVYQSNGYPKPWDGTNNGRPIPTGIYYYLIDLNDGSKVTSGSLTVVR